MSDRLGSLSTAGLMPTKQLQLWSDALTDLCGRFDIDPLDSPTFDGLINYTSVSRLKLCQIEASSHRIGHAASRIRNNEHPYVKVLFQTHGVSHFEQSGQRIDIEPGDCLVYDVACSHEIVSPDFTRHDVVIVPKDLLRERGMSAGNIPACKLSMRGGTGRIAYDFVQSVFSEATNLSPQNAAGVGESLVELLLLPLRDAAMALQQGGSEALYIRGQTFIRENLRDPQLSLDQIAAALQCTKQSLQLLFSDHGVTVSDYIWQARLHHCRQELERSTGKTIAEIASSWGFCSSAHFNRAFRKCFGVTPSAVHRPQSGVSPMIAGALRF
jgi:AraC family transcriptional regulator, positive regulator of tynA and feaB